MKDRAVFFFAIALAGCNSVWGLDEGHLVGEGGAGVGGGSSITNSATSTGGMTTSSTSDVTAGTGGGGGGCVLDTGLLNGDFSLWASSDPDHWAQTKYNCQVADSTLPSLTDGLSLGLTDVGDGAYGGLYQTVGFK
ncbi:MAG TPA: hypothetical protein VL400_06245, partial [Polyangiaceae bacterium]|nr:hypothetical protein [Polyangiaceae bacterium]